MHTRASNFELVETLPKPERTLNRRIHRRNRRVPFDKRNNPLRHLRIVYRPILNINYFCNVLDVLRNYDSMDDEPMWATNHVVALTLSFIITIPETANESAIKGNHITLVKGNQFYVLFDRILREIRAFSQQENQSLTDAWLRMNEMLQNCHGHNLSKGNIIKIFYHGLSKITQEVRNVAAGGIFLYKTPNQVYQLLEDKVLLKLDWAKYQKTKSSLKKSVAFTDEGSNSDTDKIIARMDAMTLKMNAHLDLSNVTITLQAKSVDLSFGIQQVYLQHKHYALWEVIAFGESYKAPPKETTKDKRLAGEISTSTKKKGRIMAINAEDMQKRKNYVKARTTLSLALPDEHQLRFIKYDSAKELWEAILKTFGGNEAPKKAKKNQLQAIVSHLEFMDIPIEQDDLNQKFLTSLAPEWLVYIIVWRNRDDLDTMSLDDVYNHLKVYEPKPNGSQIKYEDISQIDDDDIEEMDIKWNLDLLSMRADRSPRSQDRGKRERESYKKDPKVEEPDPKAMIAINTEEDEASKNHDLVADEEEVPTKYALMAKSSSSSDNEVLERDIELKDNKTKYLMNELEEFLESQKLDKDKKGVGFNEYCAILPPPAQVYTPFKKDLSLMGLPEFVDDTVTDYTRPTPSIDVSKSVNCKHDIWVDKGKTWSRVNHTQDNMKYISTHKSMTARAVLLKSCIKPIAIKRPFSTARPTLNCAQPKMTSFVKTSHSNVKRPFERKSADKNKVWVPTVRPKIPIVGLKVLAAKPTVATDKGNKGKVVKASARWI
nr:ribonuclease H-like domain-containing protein [Tanacetum cinerariifolium]